MHEPAPAQLAAGLQPAVDAQELPPGRAARLAGEHIAKYHPVAAQVLARQLLQLRGGVREGLALLGQPGPAGPQERPPPGSVHSKGPSSPAPARRHAPRGLRQVAHGAESVAGEKPGRNQLPECVLQLGCAQAGARAQLVEEQRTALLEQPERAPRMRSQRGQAGRRLLVPPGVQRVEQPRQILAAHQRERGRARRLRRVALVANRLRARRR